MSVRKLNEKLLRLLGSSSLHINSPLGNDRRRILSLDLQIKKGVFYMITTPCEVINQTRDRVFHQILNVERATKHDANGSIFGKRCSRYKIL